MSLTELEQQKVRLEAEIENLGHRQSFTLTEDMIRAYLEKHKQAIFSDDLLACKRIISKYVEKVMVYEDHVDVILKIVDLTGGGGPYVNISETSPRFQLYLSKPRR